MFAQDFIGVSLHDGKAVAPTAHPLVLCGALLVEAHRDVSGAPPVLDDGRVEPPQFVRLPVHGRDAQGQPEVGQAVGLGLLERPPQELRDEVEPRHEGRDLRLGDLLAHGRLLGGAAHGRPPPGRPGRQSLARRASGSRPGHLREPGVWGGGPGAGPGRVKRARRRSGAEGPVRHGAAGGGEGRGGSARDAALPGAVRRPCG